MKVREASMGHIKRLIFSAKKHRNKKSLGGVTKADLIKNFFVRLVR